MFIQDFNKKRVVLFFFPAVMQNNNTHVDLSTACSVLGIPNVSHISDYTVHELCNKLYYPLWTNAKSYDEVEYIDKCYQTVRNHLVTNIHGYDYYTEIRFAENVMRTCADTRHTVMKQIHEMFHEHHMVQWASKNKYAISEFDNNKDVLIIDTSTTVPCTQNPGSTISTVDTNTNNTNFVYKPIQINERVLAYNDHNDHKNACDNSYELVTGNIGSKFKPPLCNAKWWKVLNVPGFFRRMKLDCFKHEVTSSKLYHQVFGNANMHNRIYRKSKSLDSF